MRFIADIYRFLKLITGRGYPESREFWESCWINGQWDYLRQIDQLAHYSIIAGYVRYFKQEGSILDIGCGEGILQGRLTTQGYSKYVGVDVSDEAINRACSKQDEKTFFVREDVNNYIPSELFDIIIFNEILYYFDDPLKVLRRYEHYLNPGGIFIISMRLDKGAASLWKGMWRRAESAYISVDETKVVNKSGASWICKVFKRPK